MSKEQTLKEINASIRRCEETARMLKQLPLFDDKRKQLLPQCEADIVMLREIRTKLMEK